MNKADIRLKFNHRHPSTIHILQFFADDHLEENADDLRGITSELRDAAFFITNISDDGPELTVGLRKLLEAKESFVRHASIKA